LQCLQSEQLMNGEWVRTRKHRGKYPRQQGLSGDEIKVLMEGKENWEGFIIRWTTLWKYDLMEYIMLHLDSTNKVKQWYVRHNKFIVLYDRLHVLTCIQVIFRPSFTGESIKCYACWDPIMLTEVKYLKT